MNLIMILMVLARVPSIYGPVLAFLAEEVASATPSAYAPILNVGAVGACLVGLSLYYIKKDAAFERRIDAQLEREKDFSKLLMDQNEKYRTALEKTNEALGTIIGMLKQTIR